MSESPRIDVTGHDDDDECCDDRGSATANGAGNADGRESPVKSAAPYTSFSISSILSKDAPCKSGKQHKNIGCSGATPVSPATAAAAAFDVTAHLAAAADHAMLSRWARRAMRFYWIFILFGSVIYSLTFFFFVSTYSTARISSKTKFGCLSQSSNSWFFLAFFVGFTFKVDVLNVNFNISISPYGPKNKRTQYKANNYVR